MTPLKNQLKLHIGRKESLESNRILRIPIRTPKHQMLTKENHKSKFLQFHNLGTQILKKYQNLKLTTLIIKISHFGTDVIDKKIHSDTQNFKRPKTIFLNNLVSKAHKHIKIHNFQLKVQHQPFKLNYNILGDYL